ncbi:MAG: SpoIIIAH-like family protein [Lachnospiraceae bacterium]|nr:SpoIIIAH-like family protein [Lachnospiraceae bacterium]
MKNMVKKNQIMITALAIMIAVAGYLNFAGGKISEEEIMTTGSDDTVSVISDGELSGTEEEVAALFEISDEDMLQAENGDIESMDSEVVLQEENYMDETMEEFLLQDNSTGQSETAVTEGTENIGIAEGTEVIEITETAEATENQISESEVPGEAVFTSTTSLDTLSGARLLKEQTRAKNKETLLEVINNANISEEQKQEAIDNMIEITEIAEKETAAEILLEAKGFQDVVVSITADTVDVVVSAPELTEAQRAQIEDIVIRKTGVAPEAIVISTLAGQ